MTTTHAATFENMTLDELYIIAKHYNDLYSNGLILKQDTIDWTFLVQEIHRRESN